MGCPCKANSQKQSNAVRQVVRNVSQKGGTAKKVVKRIIIRRPL